MQNSETVTRECRSGPSAYHNCTVRTDRACTRARARAARGPAGAATALVRIDVRGAEGSPREAGGANIR